MKAVAETLEAARSHLHEKVHRLLEAVETRFAAIQAPQALEWLTDNGSVYTAVETRDFATALNLVPCFTPVQSPGIEWHLRELRQNVQARLCSRHPSSEVDPVSGTVG